MYKNLDWQIIVGGYQLAILDSAEVHKSVDILAATCTITVPLYAYNKAFRIEEQIKRGDKVAVKMGYNGQLVEEFAGYLVTINTDDSLVLECEDDIFLLRMAVPNKEFRNASLKSIVQWVIDQTKVPLKINCTLGITYDKFVVNAATAYDVLKKLQEETKANVYVKDGLLNVVPPYSEIVGHVRYSFQRNIESSSLKYKRAEDRKVQVVVEATGKDGKKREISSGTTGGDKITIKGEGLSESSMKALADAELLRHVYDGYEGDITTWLVPAVAPGYSCEIADDDFEYKYGWYYAKSVTTTLSSSGGSRKVQVGIKLVGNG